MLSSERDKQNTTVNDMTIEVSFISSSLLSNFIVKISGVQSIIINNNRL